MTTHRPPSFVFILADDLGYADLGCTSSERVPPVTPHLDRLANEGLLFTDAYANSSVCSPTRFALITGRWQYRLRGGAEEPLIGARSPSGERLGLPPEHPTLPSLLRDAGYRTALVGKWHLGFPPDFGPLRSGYQHFFGPLSGAVDYFSHAGGNGQRDLWDGEAPAEDRGYLTDLLSERACSWIDTLSPDEPFLLSLHYTAPHWPWEGRDDEAESRRIAGRLIHTDGGSLDTYRTMVSQMDEGIGRVLAALDAAGRTDDTLVIFTSDNGGERFSDNAPFLGRKMDLLEGGIRVPALARWPARIAAGARSATPTITMDWTATMLDAACIAPAPGFPLDGCSLLPVFDAPDHRFERDLCWRTRFRGQRALRRGPWKYLGIEQHEYLFDVCADPRERANLAARYPERLAELRAAWNDWNASLPPIPDDARAGGLYGEETLPRPAR